jgi:hypothetical protein
MNSLIGPQALRAKRCYCAENNPVRERCIYGHVVFFREGENQDILDP